METQNNQWYNLFQAQRLKNEGADGKTRSKGRRQIFQVKQEVGSKKEWTLLPSSTFLFYSGPQGLDGAHHIRRVIYFICPFILILNSPETSSQTHPFAQSSWHRKLTIIVCLLSAKTQLHECRKHIQCVSNYIPSTLLELLFFSFTELLPTEIQILSWEWVAAPYANSL